MRFSLVVAAGVAGLIGSALLIAAAFAADPAKPYLGMTKEAILACAGEPHARFKSGADAETLTYRYSGAGPVPAPPGQKKKKGGGLASFFPGGDKADKKHKKADQSETGDAGSSEAAGTGATGDTGSSEAASTGATGDAGSSEAAGTGATAVKGGKRGKKGKGGKKDEDWTCSASLVFEHGLLARVAFAPKDLRGPYDWQKEKNPDKREKLRNAPVPTCTFSLPNCTRAQ
jgi:hypothetical protein